MPTDRGHLAFVQHYHMYFPWLKDLDQHVTDPLEVRRRPTLFLFDADQQRRHKGHTMTSFYIGDAQLAATSAHS